MKICKRYELCYVNRLLKNVKLYFCDLEDILKFSFDFERNILYIKYCYDNKEKKYLYNYLFFNRKG